MVLKISNLVMVPSKNAVVHSTKTTHYWFEPNGILVSKVNKDAVIKSPEAIENKEMRSKLIDNIPCPILIDIRNLKEISREAKLITQKSGKKELLIAIAILVKSPLLRIIGSFELSFNRPEAPTKLFTSEKIAVKWLLMHKEQFST